jgi:endonuclease/exonuclease/phosphatase (EEP) superfamily protein YafD
MAENRVTDYLSRRYSGSSLVVRIIQVFMVVAVTSILLRPVQAEPIARNIQDCLAQLKNAGPVASRLSPAFTVVSWNIEKGKVAEWAQDLMEVPAPLDIILLQEAYYPSAFGDLLLPDVYESFSDGYRTVDLRTGVLSVSRAQPGLHCALTLSEPWLGTPKATTVTRYRLESAGDDSVLVINIHGINFEWGVQTYSQQFLLVERLLEAHRGPAIVAGDFNTWSEERSDMIAKMGLEQGLTAVEFTPDRRTVVLGRVLDHIFIRGLNAVASGSLKSAKSDHNLIWATFKAAEPVTSQVYSTDKPEQ